MAKKQAIANIVYCGLQKDESYSAEELRPIGEYAEVCTFQYLRQEQELLRLCSALKKEKIRFVLLKGSRMRAFYPSPEMRSSCDIDILTDAPDDTILAVMQSLGYQYEKDNGTTLNFTLAPLVAVEMHRFLFDDRLSFHGYFASVWDHVIPAQDGSTECFLTEEDFYLYMIAHLVKHFTRYGCGLRPLLDLYVYEREAGDLCDFAAAEKKLEEMDLLYFTEQMRELLKKWFEDGNLTEQDKELTNYLLNSGIYGTEMTIQANRFRRSGSLCGLKARLFITHVFPPLRIMRPMYPRLLRCPVFLPVAWIARLLRILFRGKMGEKTHDVMKSVDGEYISQVSDIMKRLHLQ
ncbi:MAG: nucleotidyltransferase family protein [Oscillospiraceae bacterium]|nr:nucleotidyltransferase family protein [Oscillospiraceae bacterium]